MERLFEVFEEELTAHYPKSRNDFEEQKKDRRERHFFLEYPDFDLDIAFLKYPAPGVRHLLECRVYEKCSPIFISYSRMLFALCHHKRYEHIEFCFIATEDQMKEAIRILTDHIDRHIEGISSILKNREARKHVFEECLDDLNTAFGFTVAEYDGERFIPSSEYEEEDIERVMEHHHNLSTARKYRAPYVGFLKGNTEKTLEQSAQNKDPLFAEIAQLPSSAVNISPCAIELYGRAHKGNARMLLSEFGSWLVGTIFLALPSYFLLLGIYLLAAGIFDDHIVFSIALANYEMYLYPILPALLSGVIATAFSGRLCYRFLYGRHFFSAYYLMLVSGVQKKLMRFSACLLIAMLAGIAYLGGSAGTIFEEHRIAHTDFLSLHEQYYSYENLEKVILSGEKAAVELCFKNGEVLPLYGLSVKSYHLHLENFLQEKGIETEDKQ